MAAVEQNKDFTAFQNNQQTAALHCSLRSVSSSILGRRLGITPPSVSRKQDGQRLGVSAAAADARGL